MLSPKVIAGKRVLGFLLLCWALTLPLRAQTIIDNNDGGTAVIGNLYQAVTVINGVAGGGSVTLDISGSNSVSLQQALPTASQSLTFVGTAGDSILGVVAHSGAEGAMDFQQNLSLGDGVTLNLSDYRGGVTQILDNSVSVGGTLTLGAGSGLALSAAAGYNQPVSTGLTGGTGGTASVVAQTLLFSADGGNVALSGGNGGHGSDNSGILPGAGTGGVGGSASASVTTVLLSGSGDSVNLTGGNGGSGGGGFTSGQGGLGGNTTLLGSNFTLSGSAEALSAAGGNGGNGGSASFGLFGGSGGNAAVSFGTLTLTGPGDTVNVSGGMGGNGGSGTFTNAAGGNGGNAVLTAGNLTLGSGTVVNVSAGEGGLGGPGYVSRGTAGSASVFLYSLNGSGTVNINGGTASLMVFSGDFNGSLTGNENLIVNGGGLALTLAGDNTYSGGTEVLGDLLNLGNDNALGNGNLNLQAGAILQAGLSGLNIANNTTLDAGVVYDTNSNPSTLSGVLGGGGGLSVTSSGAAGFLALTGANTYSGGTTLSSGTLFLGNSSALGSGNLTMQDGTTLQNGQAGLSLANGISLNGTDVIDSNGNSWTLSGVLSGTGSLAVTSANPGGTLTLAGANTYSGGTVVEPDGGTLNLANNNALGTGSLFLGDGTILQNGLVNLAVTNNIGMNGDGIFDSNGNHWTLSGVLSGPGDMIVLNSTGKGVLSLTGANSFGGGTQVEAGAILNIENGGNIGNNGLALEGGTLQAGGTGLFLTQGVTLSSDGGTFDCNALDSRLSGVISGDGGLAVTDSAGAGSVTLSGFNTYTGGTAVLGGTLVVAGVESLGTGPVTNLGAHLDFVTNTSAGGLTILNQGVSGSSLALLNFSGNSSAGNAVIDNRSLGNLVFSNKSTAGNSVIDNAGNAGIGFNNQSSAGGATLLNQSNGLIYFNNGSNAGYAVIENQGNMAFGGDSPATLASASYSTITNTGGLYFNAYSTGAEAVLDTENGGVLYFTGNGNGGQAQVTVNGTGVMDISGATHPVVLGSLAGSGFVSLGGQVLSVDTLANLSTLFSGVISDGGANGGTGGLLDLTGPGTLTLSGNNTYTGGTVIENGVLVAAGPNALGKGNVEIDDGTLALAGPLTIGGNYVQNSTGALQLGFNPGGPGGLLQITGTAGLAGALTLVSTNGSGTHLNESVTILDASSVAGTFDTVTDGIPESTASLAYGSSDVVLDLATTSPFSSLGTTPNQISVGKALDSLGAKSPGSPLVQYLNGQGDAALPGLYDQLSPASLAPLYQMGFATAQAEAGLVGSHVSQLFGEIGFNSNDTSWNGQDPMFAADMSTAQEASISKDLQAQRWGVFVNGLGNFGTVTGDGNGPGYQYSTGGTVAGLDYRFSKDFVGGLLLGYSSSGTSQSTGTVQSTGGQAGLYVGWKQESFYIEALAAGGVNSYTTQRQALGGTASGNTQGTQFSGQLGAGYGLKAGEVKIQPFVSGQFTSVALNAFTETGSMAPLSFGAQNGGSLSSDLGAKASHKFEMGGWNLSPQVSAAWEHVYQGNLDSLSANFGGGSNFTVNGSATGTDAAVLGAGINAAFSKGLSVYVQYQGKLGMTNTIEQNVSGGVNVGF